MEVSHKDASKIAQTGCWDAKRLLKQEK